jgi:hypothetical protein
VRHLRVHPVALLILFCCVHAEAKDKKKILLPTDVLQAATVLVVIDPDAGVSLEAPNANRIAQRDVENALSRWGRFAQAINVSTADLVIVVRKGNGKFAQPTVGGLPNNDHPVILQPTDSGGRAGGGNIPPLGGPGSAGAQRPDPSPQIEVGATEDMFVVYRGKRDDPLDAPAVWRYQAKDALSSPGVPAVDAFRKLVIEAEKQQASNP